MYLGALEPRARVLNEHYLSFRIIWRCLYCLNVSAWPQSACVVPLQSDH